MRKRIRAMRMRRGKLNTLYIVIIGITLLDQFGARCEEMREEKVAKARNVKNLPTISLKVITWSGQIARKYANITIRPPT